MLKSGPLQTPESAHPIAQLSVSADSTQTSSIVEAAVALSLARDIEDVMKVVRMWARELTGADGATFVLREENLCYYVDENAIAPLWKGGKFPIERCVSGWSMLNARPAIIEDVFSDPRVPVEAYEPTFVKSLVMVPIRTANPIGAIGNYWASRHLVTDAELNVLQALADLTSVALENIQLYSKLQNKIREVEASVKMRDEFLSVAAHELRTPLTALQLQLQSLSELATRQNASQDRLSQRACSAVTHSKRLSTLVDGLLDVSRVSSGHIAFQFESCDLVRITKDVIERFTEQAQRQGSPVSISAPESVLGMWDRLRIEQIITNLLSNAIKYGAHKPIEITVEQRPNFALLSVDDRGMGICEADRERIFERFERAVPLRHYGGLGLGLYISRKIAQAHGGNISVQSELALGSRFVVELPLHASSVASTGEERVC